MASQILRILYNTRERATSTDRNDTTNLIHRAINELAASLVGRQGGVVHGMVATVTGSGLDVTIGAGLALFNSGGATADDSEFDWVELATAETVTLPAADGSNPRWDVIEIQANDVASPPVTRDIFNPATGTFTPTSVTKRSGSQPTLSVRSGTPGSVPVFPAGIAGRIPLAYIYVDAAAATLTVGDEILCRPLARPIDNSEQGLAPAGVGTVRVRGGGILKDDVVTAAGDSRDFTVRECVGVFPGERSEFRIPDNSTYYLTASRNVEGGALPLANDMLYFYAVPTSSEYPAGYSTSLAPRECVFGSNIPARFEVVGSEPTLVVGQRNCLVVASVSAPASVDSIQGNPSAAVPGVLQFPGFGLLATNRSAWVYLGAAHWRDDIYNGVATVSTSLLAGQRTDGKGNVSVQLSVDNDYVATGDFSLWEVFNTPGSLGSSRQEDAELPITATIVKTYLQLSDASMSSANDVAWQHIDEKTPANGFRVSLPRDQSAAASSRVDFQLEMVPNSSGEITVLDLDLDSGDDAILKSWGYVDAILSRR